MWCWESQQPVTCPVIPESLPRLLLVLLGGDETQGVTTAQAWGAVISETASEKFEDDGGIWAGPVLSWDCIPAIISRRKQHCISGKLLKMAVMAQQRDRVLGKRVMPNFGAWLLEGMPWKCSRLKTPACHSGCFSSKLSETSHQLGLVNISTAFWSSNENRENLWCLQTLYPTTHLTPCFSATLFSQCSLMPKGARGKILGPLKSVENFSLLLWGQVHAEVSQRERF